MLPKEYLQSRAEEFVEEGMRQRGYTPEWEYQLASNDPYPNLVELLPKDGYIELVEKDETWQRAARRWVLHFAHSDPNNKEFVIFTYDNMSRILRILDVRQQRGSTTLVD
jgi:hypothetical protein